MLQSYICTFTPYVWTYKMYWAILMWSHQFLINVCIATNNWRCCCRAIRISWSVNQVIKQKWIAIWYDTWWITLYLEKQTCQTFVGSYLLNVTICWFYWSQMNLMWVFVFWIVWIGSDRTKQVPFTAAKIKYQCIIYTSDGTSYSHSLQQIMCSVQGFILSTNVWNGLLINLTLSLLCLQFFVCDIWNLGFWWPCRWLLLSVCYWCWVHKLMLEAILQCHTWSTCNPWWKGLLDPHSERARDIMLVSKPHGCVLLFLLCLTLSCRR